VIERLAYLQLFGEWGCLFDKKYHNKGK